jgi:endonuclease/exonuclease/phosphatase family metal-dependent hydrolase
LRLLLYNIRYGTGTGPSFHLPVPGAGYLRSSRQVLERITDFIAGRDPDIVGLIEVDTGSIRSGMVNQAEFIASRLSHFSTYQCKYGEDSFNQYHFERGNTITGAEIFPCLRKRHKDEARIIFRHADLEDRNNRIGLHARRRAEWCDGATR